MFKRGRGTPAVVSNGLGKSGTGRGTIGEVWVGWGVPWGGSGRVGGPLVMSGTGRGTLEEVRDGPGCLGEIRDGSVDHCGGSGRVW